MGIQYLLGGAAALLLVAPSTDAYHVAVSSSIPRNWWQKYPHNRLDWSRPATFQRIGIALRSLQTREEVRQVLERRGRTLASNGQEESSDPGCIVSPWLAGGEGCWGRRPAYLPLKARATVVAVAPGDSFRGWDAFIWTPKEQTVSPTQFVLMDETFQIIEGDWRGHEKGFFFQYIAEEGFRPHWWPGSMTSPHNFEHGTVHIRIEVLEQPSDAVSSLQFCIWQDNFKREACAPFWNSQTTGPPNAQYPRSIRPVGEAEPACGADWKDCRPANCCLSGDFQCIEQKPGQYAQCRKRDTGCPEGWSCGTLLPRPKTLAIKPTGSLTEVIQEQPEVSQFSQLLEISGVANTLAAVTDRYTVFAPSNEAMSALPPKTLEAINRDIVPMRAFVEAHVVPLPRKSASLPTTFQTLLGETLAFKPKEGLTLLAQEPLKTAASVLKKVASDDEEDEDFEEEKADEEARDDTVATKVVNKLGAPKSLLKKLMPPAKFLKTDILSANGYVNIIDSTIIPLATRAHEDPLSTFMNRLNDCTENFETCTHSRCCRDRSAKCLMKDQYYAQCIPRESPCPPEGDNAKWLCESPPLLTDEEAKLFVEELKGAPVIKAVVTADKDETVEEPPAGGEDVADSLGNALRAAAKEALDTATGEVVEALETTNVAVVANNPDRMR